MSEPRLEALLQELEHIIWDVVVLVETWRGESHEELRFNKHMFYGSGGHRRSCGVGFLVHERLSNVKFISLSPRLAALEF